MTDPFLLKFGNLVKSIMEKVHLFNSIFNLDKTFDKKYIVFVIIIVKGEKVGSLLEKYPHITFTRKWELKKETIFQLGQCESIIRALKDTPIPPKRRKELLNVSLIKGAQATTAIEGNTLTEEEIKKVDDGLKLPPSKKYQEIEVKNILDALNTLLKEVTSEKKIKLISIELIKRFNKMVGKNLGEHFEAIPGELRRHNVYVSNYKAPGYEDIEELLKKFCDWSIEEFHFKKDQSFLDTIIQAIVTHVYVVLIHPFGDGNGRTSRLLEFYILLRAGNPDFASHLLSNFYNLTRPEYYRQLDKSSKTGNLSNFIEYAVEGYRDGLNEILEKVQKDLFIISWNSYIYEIFQNSNKVKSRNHVLNKRRRSLILAIPINKELNIEEIVNLNLNTATTYNQLSKRTLMRDIKALIDLELIKTDASKYWANIDLLKKFIPRKIEKSK